MKTNMSQQCMCVWPRKQLHPGLHQKRQCQQVEGGDSVLLLHRFKTQPEILHHVWGSPAQERQEYAEASPEQAMENISELESLSYETR